MAKLVVQHDEDPGIAIVLGGGSAGRGLGWSGACTQCGRWVHRWRQDRAIATAKDHVDSHESAL